MKKFHYYYKKSKNLKSSNDRKIQPVQILSDYVLKFDGCSKGNPGIAGAGAVIYKDDEEIWCDCKFLGNKITNNESEYEGLLLGLIQSKKMDIQNLLIQGDSQLVIKQMKGEFKVKSPNLILLHETCMELTKTISVVNFQHIYRQHNIRADELSNIAVEKR
jgi:ribonuclease HI